MDHYNLYSFTGWNLVHSAQTFGLNPLRYMDWLLQAWSIFHKCYSQTCQTLPTEKHGGRNCQENRFAGCLPSTWHTFIETNEQPIWGQEVATKMTKTLQVLVWVWWNMGIPLEVLHRRCPQNSQIHRPTPTPRTLMYTTNLDAFLFLSLSLWPF